MSANNGNTPVLGGEFSAGLTRREWFVAHAPPEPPPWFVPAMPPRPALPSATELSESDRRDFDNDLFAYEPERCSEQLREFIARRNAAWEAVNEWDRAQAREHYLQWPLAWADAMLARLAEPQP